MIRSRAVAAIAVMMFISACASKPEPPPYAGIKIGKPYEVYGQWYEPKYNQQYDEIGKASWYGPGFHGGHTATGERYDQEELTAAHRTLPLPSIVRVTNLDNGKSALIRINDRGPFAHSRIIDLSHAAAVKLDMIRSGTAKVRVQFLDAETRRFVQNWQAHGLEYADNALQSISPQMASTEPQLKLEPRIFGSAPVQDVALNQGQAAPLPPPVSIANEPAAAPSPAQPQPPVSREVSLSQNDGRYDDQPDIFSMVDQKPVLTPAVYTPSPSNTAPPNAAPQAVVAAHAAISPQTNHGFFVQAGTFGLEGNAHRLWAKVEAYGDSQIMEIMSGGHKLYRVMLGPFHAQNDAKNMLSKLAGLGISDAKIIRN